MNSQNAFPATKLFHCISRHLRAFHPLWWLLTLLILAACRTVPQFAPVDLSGKGWTLMQGQAIWRSSRNGPEIAGELLVATHEDGRSFLQFTKTPLPFVVVQTTTNAWQIRLVADNRTYSGPDRPPAQLAWLQLPLCLSGINPPARWRWERFETGRWRLENNLTGEMIEGYLTRPLKKAAAEVSPHEAMPRHRAGILQPHMVNLSPCSPEFSSQQLSC